jgi:hypothetical protein
MQLKNQALLLSGAKGKALAVQRENALRRAREVPIPQHGVGLTWLKPYGNCQRNGGKVRLAFVVDAVYNINYALQ